MAERHEFPFRLREYSDEFKRRVRQDFGEGVPKGFVKTNHWGYNLMGGTTEETMKKLYNQPVEEGDVWVVTLPKCGTTWTQEMVWLLANDLDYAAARAPLGHRWHFLEMLALHDWDYVREKLNKAKEVVPDLPVTFEEIMNLKSGHFRFVKSHLPLSLCPPDLLNKAKVIYVARNPKDMLVSYFNHLKLLKLQGFDSELDTLFEYFLKGEALGLPFFPHVLEAWNLRQHPNMCFLFFEDMKKDLKSQIVRVAKFLGKDLTDEQLSGLSSHLSFDNFKRNPFVNNEYLKEIPGFMDKERSFINKGKTGNWKSHFTAEMTSRMDAWVAENLRGTDLTFVDQLS